METPKRHKIGVECLSHWWTHLASPNPNVVWDLLRHTVQHQLLNNQAIALPFLSEMRFYPLHAAVIKIPASAAKRVVFGEPIQYQPAGELLRLVAEMTQGCKDKVEKVKRTVPDKMEQHWRAALSDKRGGAAKVSECQLERTAIFEPNDLRFNVELLSKIAGEKDVPPPSLYIVHERYVGTMYISATVGQESEQFVYQNFPVGIVLYKYRLETDGTVEFAKEIRGDNFAGEWRHITEASHDGERPSGTPVVGVLSTPSPRRPQSQTFRTPDLRVLFSAGKHKTPKH
uniref:Uncharacterized protein n=1 Tax=Trichuris muris TaxID=70415 RepID=A0A5S6QSN3_TRIMR